MLMSHPAAWPHHDQRTGATLGQLHWRLTSVWANNGGYRKKTKQLWEAWRPFVYLNTRWSMALASRSSVELAAWCCTLSPGWSSEQTEGPQLQVMHLPAPRDGSSQHLIDAPNPSQRHGLDSSWVKPQRWLCHHGLRMVAETHWYHWSIVRMIG